MPPSSIGIAVLALIAAVSLGPVSASTESAAAQSAAELVFETEDWTFRAPDSLGTQADLELNARQVQLCTDEIEGLVRHRPRNVARFSMVWVVDGLRYSTASPTGVTNHVPSHDYRLVDPIARSFRESVVARGACFGPHEVTHVLTWDSWGQAWANEGFANFTDRLYDGASWRCCDEPLQLRFDCDETGYTDGFTRNGYSNLQAFVVSTEMYNTATCFWLEVYRRGGFRAIRRILMRTRAGYPRTTGELVVHHVSHVLGEDFRPIARRYGFTDSDLTAVGDPPPDPTPASIVASKLTRSPLTPRAGGLVRATLTATRGDTGDPLDSARVECPAQAGGRRIAAVSRAFDEGLATCVWRVPRAARRKTLVATVRVVRGDVAASRAFRARIR